MMKSGICPKCGSHDIYAKREQRRYAGNFIKFDVWHGAIPDIYICGQCGFVEKYISTGFDQIFKKWKKISPRNE